MTTLKRLEKGDTVIFKNEPSKEYEVISVRKSSAVVSGWSVSIRPANNKKGLIDKGWDQGWFVKTEKKFEYSEKEVKELLRRANKANRMSDHTFEIWWDLVKKK